MEDGCFMSFLVIGHAAPIWNMDFFLPGKTSVEVSSEKLFASPGEVKSRGG